MSDIFDELDEMLFGGADIPPNAKTALELYEERKGRASHTISFGAFRQRLDRLVESGKLHKGVAYGKAADGSIRAIAHYWAAS